MAIKTVFPDAKRIENCGIAKRETNNSIERMNGTLRERVKVQRGWKTEKTALAEGNRIQYNFVKPHIALKGKTPAQAAGIESKGMEGIIRARSKTNLKRYIRHIVLSCCRFQLNILLLFSFCHSF